jgi:hypothetical protein
MSNFPLLNLHAEAPRMIERRMEIWYNSTMSEKPKFACRKEAKEVMENITSGDFAKVVAEELCLFLPSEEPEKVGRAKIPEELKSRIQPFGEIIDAPSAEDYDPENPNLYIIGVGHVADQESKTKFQKIQKNAVKVFHQLYELGVRQQFIEGMPKGEKLDHDKRDPELEEHPLDAIPKYKEEGKIKRAYIAIEGIYEDEVDSIGADDKGFLQLKRDHERASRILRPQAMNEIFDSIAKEMRVEVDRKRLGNRQYRMSILKKIKAKISQLSAEEKEIIITEYVLGNDKYKEYIDIAKRFWYKRIQGRNNSFATTIKGEGRKDSAMVVGAHHSEHLKKQFPNFNVFVIAPRGVEKSRFKYPKSSFEEEDYKKDIMKEDLAVFGLE